MYPVRLGYITAKKRISKLIKNSHYCEAFVTTVFTVEKTFRRTLRELIVSSGFTSDHADKIVNNCRGLDMIKKVWELYDPRNRKLVEQKDKKLAGIISQTNWEILKDSADMRNDLVHGKKVFTLAKCKDQTKLTLAVLDKVKEMFDDLYGYSGWSTLSTRLAHKLHQDPKVKI